MIKKYYRTPRHGENPFSTWDAIRYGIIATVSGSVGALATTAAMGMSAPNHEVSAPPLLPTRHFAVSNVRGSGPFIGLAQQILDRYNQPTDDDRLLTGPDTIEYSIPTANQGSIVVSLTSSQSRNGEPIAQDATAISVVQKGDHSVITDYELLPNENTKYWDGSVTGQVDGPLDFYSNKASVGLSIAHQMLDGARKLIDTVDGTTATVPVLQLPPGANQPLPPPVSFQPVNIA